MKTVGTCSEHDYSGFPFHSSRLSLSFFATVV
jgi:hypothetical protein